jgi:geranylgeranyl reductase family protein
MNHPDCDVLIVGAGPAGSTAAFILAGRGLKVVLLDRCAFPRPKLCGGLLTLKSVQILERIFKLSRRTLKSSGLIGCETRRYAVADRYGHALTRRLDDPFHLVDRTTYDEFWLRQAVCAGAELHAGAAVVALYPARGEALTADGRRWRARIVIGADGVDSRIRHALQAAGSLRPPRRRGRAASLECLVPRQPGSFPEHPTIYFGRVPWGYAWSFPGPSRQVLGIAALKTRGRRLKDDFRDFLRELKIPLTDPLRLHGHGLPYGNYLKTPGHRNTLLIGDAAGLADPFLGEGIYYAHRSAELAAQAVLASFERPEEALSAYRGMFRRRLLPEMRYAWAGRQIIFALPPRLYYPFLSLFLRVAPKIGEQTIQGQRSFRWFRLKTPCPR